MPGGDLEVDVRGYGIVASPAGDRTVLRAYGGPVPVLDPRVPQVAFTLSGYAVLGAAFAATGDTLYVLRSGRLSGMSFFDDSVMVLDARSGAQLRAVSASGADTSLLWPLYLEFSDLILDPNGRWIYALGASSDAGRSVVLVYERASLALVGELRLPPDVNPTVEGPVAMTHCTSNEVDYCSRRLLMSASERRLYLATYNRWSYEDAPQVVFRYDLIP
jgi:hypothetical protein